MQGLENKVTVVAGGRKGIEKATVTRMTAEEIAVVVAELDREAVRDTVSEIRASDGRATAIETDVTDTDAAAETVEIAFEEYGKLDIGANNAAVIIPLGFFRSIHWNCRLSNTSRMTW
ncbi:short chain dehydrogenase [Halogranum amylolyticum]|uniref:Short chain dehydrogenase n=2 Tax=Halogranum amylolyticum TaxID=660520 RepID=A0A1H8ULX7_9EURY|nr:short chain dehydrogenase [Halogranum amylolyticum]